MADIKTFSEQVLQALEEKTQWYDSEGLPALLESYRMLHTCVKNLYDYLIKKSLIKKDPYKLDKKISDIVAPENTNFSEGDRSVVIGMRFSDYDSTLDFLCNYYKFAISNMSLGTVKKLVEFNKTFQWNAFSINSTNPNTRGLAGLVADGRKNGDQFSISLLSDSVSKASKALNDITATLKELLDFLKEDYKGKVRRNMFIAGAIDFSGATSVDSELQLIKKNFSASMGKVPFYSELIDELVQEDVGDTKEALQQAVLAKLNVKAKKEERKEPEIDTKELLMDSVRALGALSPQIDTVLNKIKENHDVLESEHNKLLDKLKRAFRRAFNIAEKPLYYQIVITDEASDTKRRERINYQTLVTELGARSRRYAAGAAKENPGYQRIYSQPEDKVLEYVNNQLFDCQKLLKLIAGLDDFFKTSALPQNKPRIKGLKMELTSIKNCVVKANQYRADYTAYVEEAAQFKKLGIVDEE